ncbi:Hsp70 family protein [Glycomyces luteolus]|uniref:Hsp70 family protein n=1 Tax=Glycomyces luteolus TaxID=2670330 RepID=A0A9X3P5U2_9ACTN|nr:Hsp70 family protein [Glycomyces luteolus]MDA1358614.1 Hsp70 family protein [Glycomyces luteolus]
MQPSPRAVAVGVDLGSSTTTVSTRRIDHRTEAGEAPPGAARSGTASDDAAPPALPVGETALVVLAVPATWTSTRRRAHAEAAANAGFEPSILVSEPEAAARQYAEVQGGEAESQAPLVVCNIGAGSCHIGVVSRESDHYTVQAAKSADDIGGREFDRLLLEHLAARHRQAEPEFWARAGDPAETVLRAGVLDEVRRAREYLTDHPSVAVSLPGLARDLRLTREDADQCLTPAILRTVGLVEEAMRDAAIEADQIAGVLLVGGVSRMPLVAAVLGHHLGVDPVRTDLPDLVIAEGAALAGLARIRSDSGEPAEAPAGFARLRTSPDVLATIMVVVFAVASFAGVVLLNRGGPDADEIDSGLEPTSEVVGETTIGEAEPGPELTPSDAGGSTEPSATEPAESAEEVMASPSGTSPSPSDSTPVSSATPLAPPASDQAATTAKVPDVVGATVADARRMLAEAGFTNVAAQGDRRDTESPSYDDCEVTAQTPSGGSRAEQDAAVALQYVYVGTDSC